LATKKLLFLSLYKLKNYSHLKQFSMKANQKRALKQAFILFLCLSAGIVQAQLINPTRILQRAVEKKVEKKVNEKVDKKIDETANKAADKIVDGMVNGKKSEVDSTDGKKTGKLGGKLGKIIESFDATPKTSYAFSSSILQKMTTVRKSKSEVGHMKVQFNKESTAFSVEFLDDKKTAEGEKMSIIMDLEQKTFFTFSTTKKGEKNYFGIRLNEEALKDAETKSTPTKPEKTFTKTGKTKTIMGYSCEGYQMDGDNGDTFILWVTTSSVAGMDDYAKAMKQYGAQQRQKQTAPINSTIETWAKQGKAVLGNDHISKNGDQLLTELEKISLSDPSNFSTAGYKSAFGK
jgi:hypothetical protein